jgi:NhaC family Na+:H+ antiporter
MGKNIPLWQIAIVMLFMIAALAWTIVKVEGYVHMALLASALLAAIVAVANGFKWVYLEKGIINNIGRSMQAILIFLQSVS